jgi:hypothetical protein
MKFWWVRIGCGVRDGREEEKEGGTVVVRDW